MLHDVLELMGKLALHSIVDASHAKDPLLHVPVGPPTLAACTPSYLRRYAYFMAPEAAEDEDALSTSCPYCSSLLGGC